MKKAFKEYYDPLKADDQLLENIPQRKKRYFQYVLIITVLAIVFTSIYSTNHNEDSFKVLAFHNNAVTNVIPSKNTLDYYLIFQDVSLQNQQQIEQLKSDYIKKYIKTPSAFIDSDLSYNESKTSLYGYVTSCYFTVDIKDDDISALRIHNTATNDIKITNGENTYKNDVTISYDDYKKYDNTVNSLKVVWLPTSLYYQSNESKLDYTAISDNIQFEVIYKDGTIELFIMDITFNKKGQMMVNQRTGELKTLENSQEELLSFSSIENDDLYVTIKEILPQPVIDELIKNGLVYQENHYISIKNDKDEPTLRLDFEFDDNHQITSYVSKEYGFVDEMTIDALKDPVEVIQSFKHILLNNDLEITPATLPSHYEGGDYVAYSDGIYVYVEQTTKNMVVNMSKIEE